MKSYRINIVGLSNSIHQFSFEIGDDFFCQYEGDLISKGHFTVNIDLNKHETFIECDFKISGVAQLICDRSVEIFDYPINDEHRIVFKFGSEDQEITDEIMMINRDTVSLELGQYIYEFIALAVPMKKLHPRFQNEDEEETEGRIIYSSGDEIEKEDKENIDPRWEQLKKLK